MKKMTENFKSVLKLAFRYKYRIFCLVLVLLVLFSGFHYRVSENTGSVNISLNYAEASSGLNPNKTRFNSYEIMSDEVLSEAIRLTGLKDALTAEALASCISVTPVDTGNVNGDDNYISTTYNLTLNTSALKIKNRSAGDLLKNICAAYKNYFLDNYCDNQDILRAKLDLKENKEPYIRLNEINLRVKELDKYLAGRIDENRSFVDESTGDSFVGVDKKLKNIVNYDIPNASAFIIECGVAESPDTLAKILEYKNKIVGMSADKYMAYYDADNAGIKAYNKAMSAVVLIPTVDEADQYYMSRTKTAMDKMARAADAELSEATGYKKNIIETNYVIKKIREHGTNEENLLTAKGMIEKIETALNSPADELFTLDKAYIGYKAQNYITFNYYTPSFIRKIDVKKTVIETAAALVILFGAAYVKESRKEINTDEKI